MKKVTTYEDLVNQHKSAMHMFGDNYSFKTKQNDILFDIRMKLTKELSQQIADQRIIDKLTKKVEKRQIVIDKITNEQEIAKSFTEEDLLID